MRTFTILREETTTPCGTQEQTTKFAGSLGPVGDTLDTVIMIKRFHS